MPIEPVYLILGAILLVGFFLLQALYIVYSDRLKKRRRAGRRMRMLSAGAPGEQAPHQLRRAASDRWSRLGPAGRPLRWLGRLAGQSGLPLTVERLVALMAGLTALPLLAVALLALRGPGAGPGQSALMLGCVLSLAVGVGGPVLYLSALKARRVKKFSEQLPDTLDMIVRSLRVGHPVNVALRIAADEMPDPMGTELGIAVEEMVYGLDLRDALANLSERIDQQDFQYVVVAIGIQHDTGGNLADVLSGLANVIRSRFRMFNKIRALSSEGRFSAKILGALPFGFGVVTFLARPAYYLDVSADPIFVRTMVVAFALQLIGIFIMHKMIHFRI